MEKKRPDVITK